MSDRDEEYFLSGTDISLTALPKVSLHDHLDGGLRPESIIELADAIGFELPASTTDDLADWFENSADSGRSSAI